MQGQPNPRLIRCQDCGRPISMMAERCPACGGQSRPAPPYTPFRPSFGDVFRVVFFAAVAVLALSLVLALVNAVLGGLLLAFITRH
jgi:predicted amidophosphoribosyltransferase